MSTYRFILTRHADGHETVAVYSATEIGQHFNAEEVACLALGKPVFRDGNRLADMQVAASLHLDTREASLVRRMLGAVS